MGDVHNCLSIRRAVTIASCVRAESIQKSVPVIFVRWGQSECPLAFRVIGCLPWSGGAVRPDGRRPISLGGGNRGEARDGAGARLWGFGGCAGLKPVVVSRGAS